MGLILHILNSGEQIADGISLTSFNDAFNEIFDSKDFATESEAKFISLRDQDDYPYMLKKKHSAEVMHITELFWKEHCTKVIKI